jgi:hypothetical protein
VANHVADFAMYNHSWLCRKSHLALPESPFGGLPNFDGLGIIAAIISPPLFDKSVL